MTLLWLYCPNGERERERETNFSCPCHDSWSTLQGAALVQGWCDKSLCAAPQCGKWTHISGPCAGGLADGMVGLCWVLRLRLVFVDASIEARYSVWRFQPYVYQNAALGWVVWNRLYLVLNDAISDIDQLTLNNLRCFDDSLLSLTSLSCAILRERLLTQSIFPVQLQSFLVYWGP